MFDLSGSGSDPWTKTAKVQNKTVMPSTGQKDLYSITTMHYSLTTGRLIVKLIM